MDPITALATIVGLLSNFKSERSSGDLPEFLHWLKEKRHEDIADSVRNNQRLFQALSVILSANHEQILARLNQLDLSLSSIAGQMIEFAELAHTIHPEGKLSDQAVSILQQLVSSGAKLFMEHEVTTGSPAQYLLMEGGTGNIKYDEPQFMEDDLNTLVELGLLRLEFGSKGSRKFLVTRDAVRLVKKVDSS